MGNLCSCCGNRSDDIFESPETDKTNLLGNPIEGSSGVSGVPNKYSSANEDQQAKLTEILQKTANSYIDVPALNSPMDQPADKTKDYESKIKGTLEKHQITEKTSLLEDIPHIERTLSNEPLSEGDQKMVKDAHSLILTALQAIHVENSESLVIPFEIPKDKQ